MECEWRTKRRWDSNPLLGKNGYQSAPRTPSARHPVRPDHEEHDRLQARAVARREPEGGLPPRDDARRADEPAGLDALGALDRFRPCFWYDRAFQTVAFWRFESCLACSERLYSIILLFTLLHLFPLVLTRSYEVLE